MKMTKKHVTAAAVLAFATACAGAIPLPAEAMTISAGGVGLTSSDVGSTFEVDWDFANPLLTGKEVFTIKSFTSSDLKLSVDVTNTTNTGYTDRLTSWGFNTDKDITAVHNFSSTGNVFAGTSLDANLPNVSNSIEVCVFAGNNCPGGSNKGLKETKSSTVVFDLLGSFGSSPSISLDTFGLKYQSAGPNAQSYEFTGEPKCLTNCGSPKLSAVPLPGALPLFIGGLGGLGWLRFRKRRRNPAIWPE